MMAHHTLSDLGVEPLTRSALTVKCSRLNFATNVRGRHRIGSKAVALEGGDVR